MRRKVFSQNAHERPEKEELPLRCSALLVLLHAAIRRGGARDATFHKTERCHIGGNSSMLTANSVVKCVHIKKS